MGTLQMPNQAHETVARRVQTDFTVVQMGKLEHREVK